MATEKYGIIYHAHKNSKQFRMQMSLDINTNNIHVAFKNDFC